MTVQKMTQHDRIIDEMSRSYAEAILFTDVYYPSDDAEPIELYDMHISVDDLPPKFLVDCALLCERFFESIPPETWQAYREAYLSRPNTPADQMGYDLWMTSQGHGVGFWDRDLGTVGDELAELARSRRFAREPEVFPLSDLARGVHVHNVLIANTDPQLCISLL